jgi:hypothetical protein
VRATSLPRILTSGGWLKETNPIIVGQCGFRHYLTLGRVDLGLPPASGETKYRSPASLVLNLSQGRSVSPFPTVSPGYSPSCFLTFAFPIVHRQSQSRTKYFHVDTFPLSATRHHIYVHSAPGLPASGHLLSNPALTFHLNIAIYALPPFVIMRSRSSSTTSSTSGKSLPTDNIQIFVAISGGKSEQKPLPRSATAHQAKLTGSPKR